MGLLGGTSIKLSRDSNKLSKLSTKILLSGRGWHLKYFLITGIFLNICSIAFRQGLVWFLGSPFEGQIFFFALDLSKIYSFPFKILLPWFEIEDLNFSSIPFFSIKSSTGSLIGFYQGYKT